MTNSNQLDFHEPTLQQVADLCSQFGFTCAGEADLACLRAVLREGFLRWGNHSADASKMVGHQPAPPAAGEVAYLVRELRDQADDLSPSLELFGLIHNAADLLEQRHPAPVPVGERLPGLEDCDAEGMCWAWRSFDPEEDDFGDFWMTIPCEWLEGSERWTHWLSYPSLPLPDQK